MENLEKMFSDENELNKILSSLGLDVESLEDDMKKYSPKKDVFYRKKTSEVKSPEYAYETDSGFDLYATEEVILEPFGRALIPTGLFIDIPEGYEIQIRSKSGLAINQGLMVLNSPGTVDFGFLGEIKVILFNTNPHHITIPQGMKVAQAVLSPVLCGKWVNLIEKDDLGTKDRNENGFGSTGI
jgi:dUTP pyrophosphatase